MTVEERDKLLGQTIRALREERGRTLRALARFTELSPAHLSRIENGSGGGSEETLMRVAAALRVHPGPLLVLAEHGDGAQARERLLEALEALDPELADDERQALEGEGELLRDQMRVREQLEGQLARAESSAAAAFGRVDVAEDELKLAEHRREAYARELETLEKTRDREDEFDRDLAERIKRLRASLIETDTRITDAHERLGALKEMARRETAAVASTRLKLEEWNQISENLMALAARIVPRTLYSRRDVEADQLRTLFEQVARWSADAVKVEQRTTSAELAAMRKEIDEAAWNLAKSTGESQGGRWPLLWWDLKRKLGEPHDTGVFYFAEDDESFDLVRKRWRGLSEERKERVAAFVEDMYQLSVRERLEAGEAGGGEAEEASPEVASS